MQADQVQSAIQSATRRRLRAALATFCVGCGLLAIVAPAATATPPPASLPSVKAPTSGAVKATVSVAQEDDVFELSPGMDYSAAMSWRSTKEEGKRNPDLTSLSGQGTFNGAVDATLLYPPDTVCGNPHYKLNASGAVESLSNLQFSFVPKDISRPGLGLKGWSIRTPTAQWKGTMEVEKSAPCENSSQDGGSTFDGATLVGGTKTGGTRIAAPRVVVSKSGGVTISGEGTVIVAGATGAVSKKQVIKFSVSCAQLENCFGYGEDGSEGLEHSWKYLGASCEQGPGNTVRLRVKMRMSVRNGDGFRNWAQGMRAQARLVPTTAGANYTRQWRGQYRGGLVQGSRYTQDFEFLTDTVSPTRDWALELKYTWDRNLDRDVVEQFKGKSPIACL